MFAAEVDHRLGPGRLHNINRLVGTAAAFLNRHPQGVKLLLQPAGPYPDDRAAAGQHVDCGQGFGRGQRMAVGQDEDCGAQLDPGRFERQGGQHAQRLEKRVVRVEGIAALHLGRKHQMVGHPDCAVAQRLGRLGCGGDSVGRVAHRHPQNAFLGSPKLLAPAGQRGPNFLLALGGGGVLPHQLVDRLTGSLGLAHVGVEKLQLMATQAVVFGQTLHEPGGGVLPAAFSAD